MSCVSIAAAKAQDQAAGIVVTQAWSRATPGGAKVAGGYLIIENRGQMTDRLLSGSAEAAKKVEIHEMALELARQISTDGAFSNRHETREGNIGYRVF